MRFYNVRDLRADGLFIERYSGPALEVRWGLVLDKRGVLTRGAAWRLRLPCWLLVLRPLDMQTCRQHTRLGGHATPSAAQGQLLSQKLLGLAVLRTAHAGLEAHL